MSLDEIFEETAIDPWFLAQIQEIVATEKALAGRTLDSLSVPELRFLKRKGFSDKRLARLLGTNQHDLRRRRHALGVRPVYKRVDTCAAEFATPTAYMYSTYDEECEAEPTDAQEDHGAGRRAQPHRPGHRVRLLLRACRAGHARGWLRDHHGQLQPGDGVHRLRHQRPAVLRAGDAGRRARDRRGGKAARRDRAVRRPDAAEAGAGARGQRRADHRHQPGQHRHGRGPRALPAAAAHARPEAAAEPHRAHRRGRAGAGAADRLPAGGAAELRARRPRDGDRARRQGPAALHARGGQGVGQVAGAARPLPRRRHRGRCRLHQRWQQRDDRRHHGAHRTGGRALRRLGLLAAAVFAAAPRCRTSCAARPR